MKATVIGIIPARYGSTRLPGKPLLKIGGKPVIQHVYERSRKAARLSDIIVATDDERISAAVSGFGGKSVITPVTLQSGSDRVAYVARTLEADVIVNIQGDEPLIEPDMIDETVRVLLDNEGVEVSTPVKKIGSAPELSDPNVVKVAMDEAGYALYFSRSVIPFLQSGLNRSVASEWLTRHQYYKHIGLYVYRKQFLLMFTQWKSSSLERAEQLEQLRILEHGHRIRCVVTEYDSYSVDTPEDLLRLERLIVNT